MQGARAQPNSIEQPTVTNLMRGTLFGSEPVPLQRCILWGKNLIVDINKKNYLSRDCEIHTCNSITIS